MNERVPSRVSGVDADVLPLEQLCQLLCVARENRPHGLEEEAGSRGPVSSEHKLEK